MSSAACHARDAARAGATSTPVSMRGRALIDGRAEGDLLYADVGLSFWGGVEPSSGEIIDRHHPLSGQHVDGRVLAIPSGRGSCTGSSVMMELISRGRAPAALVVAEAEEILTLGVMLAEVMFARSLPVLCVGRDNFAALRGARRVRIDGARLTRLDTATTGAPAHAGGQDGGGDGDGDDHGAATAPPPSMPPPSMPALTASDQDMLAGHHGKARQVAMQIVVRMASLQGAPDLIDITQAHIDGCIYTGPSSLRFAQQLVDWGARVAVPTTLNSISVDQRRWRELGVDPALGEPASALGDAYMAMGAQLSYTCAPYLLAGAPRRGEQIVWAESNAVVYANSVIGARTLKYPDFLDICIAICGRAPRSGSHLDVHRRPTLRIDVSPPAGFDDAFYPLLGYCIGALAGKRVPLIFGLETAQPDTDHLKAFSAAFGTTSAAPLFHMAGVTPEAAQARTTDPAIRGLERIALDAAALLPSWQALNSASGPAIDLVSLGNPHFSLTEFARLAGLCQGLHLASGVACVVTCGREIARQAQHAGYLRVIQDFGATIVTDTCWCMLGEPVIPRGACTIMTNSAKYAHYAPGLVQRNVRFGSLADCVSAGVSGKAPATPPRWLLGERDTGA